VEKKKMKIRKNADNLHKPLKVKNFFNKGEAFAFEGLSRFMKFCFEPSKAKASPISYHKHA
jgi:hypothetical protein